MRATITMGDDGSRRDGSNESKSHFYMQKADMGVKDDDGSNRRADARRRHLLVPEGRPARVPR